jgi:hypothetical protein
VDVEAFLLARKEEEPKGTVTENSRTHTWTRMANLPAGRCVIFTTEDRQDDRFASITTLAPSVPGGTDAVETDHAAIRGGVIAFLTERSSGGRAPGHPSWGKARAAARTREPGAALLPSRVCTSALVCPIGAKAAGRRLGVHATIQRTRRGSARVTGAIGELLADFDPGSPVAATARL